MKILVGYDGSQCARDALKLAAEHARAFKAQVVVAATVDTASITYEADVNNAKEDLAFAAEWYASENVDYETQLLDRGLTPGESLVKWAEENGVGEIVIGVKRRSKVGKLLFGSTAQYVILSAPCPVVTIR